MSHCDRWDKPAYMSETCPKKANTWQKRLKKADIPTRYWDANRANIKKIDPIDTNSWKSIGGYMNNLVENIARGQGLLLYGPFGTGKTTAGIMVAQEALAFDYTVKFISAAYLINELRSMPKDSDANSSFRQSMAMADLLVLDGLEIDLDSNWLINEIGAILARRYDLCKPLIITTNSSVEALAKHLPERYVDRILATCTALPLTGRNWRR